MSAVVNLVSDISVSCRQNCFLCNNFFFGRKKKKSKARKKRSYSVPTEVQKNQRGLQKEKTCLIIFDDKTENCID